MRHPTTLTAVLGALTAIVALAPPPATAAAYGGWREMAQPGNGVPCRYEDSRSCVWDARHRGNGIGRSFISGARGGTHYVSHRVAHRSLHG